VDYEINAAHRFFFRDDGCDGKTTLGVTAELHYEQNVDVYVGMPCSAGSQSQYMAFDSCISANNLVDTNFLAVFLHQLSTSLYRPSRCGCKLPGGFSGH